VFLILGQGHRWNFYRSARVYAVNLKNKGETAMKTWRFVTWIGLAFVMVLAAACGAANASEPTATPVPSPQPMIAAGGLEELVEALRALGLTVEVGGPIDDPLFSGEGRYLRVNGVDLQVFEYASEAEREAESGRITEYGSPSPTMIVEWIAPPHFWAQGRLIVLYVGYDKALAGQLTAVLGEPVAVGSGGLLPPPGPSAEAVEFLRAQLGAAAETVAVVSVEPMDWSDSCLGLGGPAESCLAAITPGYRIVLSVDGVEYVVRSDLEGSALRLE
jgi:hypothetical protein